MKRLKIAQEVIKSSFNIFLNSVGTSKVHDQNEEEVKVSINQPVLLNRYY